MNKLIIPAVTEQELENATISKSEIVTVKGAGRFVVMSETGEIKHFSADDIMIQHIDDKITASGTGGSGITESQVDIRLTQHIESDEPKWQYTVSELTKIKAQNAIFSDTIAKLSARIAALETNPPLAEREIDYSKGVVLEEPGILGLIGGTHLTSTGNKWVATADGVLEFSDVDLLALLSTEGIYVDGVKADTESSSTVLIELLDNTETAIIKGLTKYSVITSQGIAHITFFPYKDAQ